MLGPTRSVSPGLAAMLSVLVAGSIARCRAGASGNDSLWKMPLIFSGTGDNVMWLSIGQRGIDTAFAYGPIAQDKVAKAVASSGVPRSEIFITSKLFPGLKHKTSLTEQGLFSLSQTQAGYFDCLLMHFPDATFESTLAAWPILEDFKDRGLAKHIGVSNFNQSLLRAFYNHPWVRHKPEVLQNGYSVGFHRSTHFGSDDATFALAKAYGMQVFAYSAIGGWTQVPAMEQPTVKAIASKYGVHPAEVCIAWVVQQGIGVITSTFSKSHALSDVDGTTLALSASDMKLLSEVPELCKSVDQYNRCQPAS